MLLGSFFTINNKSVTGKNVQATIAFNAAHAIFEGHFPGQPVVPGVCMVQVIKEVMETVTGTKLQLQKADTLKFLSVINPLENPEIGIEYTYEQNENAVTLNGRLFKDAVNFLKFRASFISNM